MYEQTPPSFQPAQGPSMLSVSEAWLQTNGDSLLKKREGTPENGNGPVSELGDSCARNCCALRVITYLCHPHSTCLLHIYVAWSFVWEMLCLLHVVQVWKDFSLFLPFSPWRGFLLSTAIVGMCKRPRFCFHSWHHLHFSYCAEQLPEILFYEHSKEECVSLTSSA